MKSWPPASVEALTALADRVCAGDRAAEAELVERLYPGVRAIARIRLRDRDAAGEAAQETMLALINALRAGRLREASKVAAFAHGIVLNVIRGRRRTIREESRDEPLAPEHLLVTPDDPVQAREERQALRDALGDLEPIDRRILMLTLVEGLAPAEIGRRLGVHAELVRTRKSRAVKKVIEAIGRLTRPAASRHIHK